MKLNVILRGGAVGLLAVVAAGCGGGPKHAAVSGVVTIDGKPYGEAVVVFQPLASKDNPNPGRGSSAYTDENGRFVLKSVDGDFDGAVVGKHRVRIMTKGNVVTIDPSVGSADGDVKNPTKAKLDPIPPEWHSMSTKEFDVPPGGTDKADFAIETRKGGKK